MIHHYFLAKGISLLKEGGILAMVVPQYCLDNRTQHARWLARDMHARLHAAYRFPDNCFQDAKVTVDVVFFQKMANRPEKSDWCQLDEYPIGKNVYSLNRYFSDRPDHIFGELVEAPMFGRTGLTCRCPNEKIIKMMEAAVKGMPPLQEGKNSQDVAAHILKIEQQIEQLQQTRQSLLTIQQKMAALQAEAVTLTTRLI